MASHETLQKLDRISTELLEQDVPPTIDGAVKSFVSLYTARRWTTTTKVQAAGTRTTTNENDSKEQQQQQDEEDPLVQARLLLKTINQYTFPLLPSTTTTRRKKEKVTSSSSNVNEDEDDYTAIAQLWNGVVASKNQKPAKVFGKRPLLLAWNHGLLDEIQQQTNDDGADNKHPSCLNFCKEFGSLLLEYMTTMTNAQDQQQQQQQQQQYDRDNDACLVWDPDRGQAELARRRQRRSQRAKEQQQRQQQQQQEESSSMSIEQVVEDEEGDDDDDKKMKDNL